MIATKVHGRMRPAPNGAGLSRKAIMTEIDASLRRLGTDYVDLYQIHRWDPTTPIEETLEALHDVVKAGKARYIGASSMCAWQFAKVLHLAERQRLDPLRHDAEPRQPALPRGGARDAAAVPRRGHRRDPVEPAGARPADPRLGRGERSAPDSDEFGRTLYAATADADRSVVEAVAAVASRRGVPRAQVALAWVLAKAGITAPIVGATRSSSTSTTRSPRSNWHSAADEIAALEAPYVPHPVAGH